MLPGARRSDNFRTSNSSSNRSSVISDSDLDFTKYTSYGYFGNYSHLTTRRGNNNFTSSQTFSDALIMGPTRRHGICQVSLS